MEIEEDRRLDDPELVAFLEAHVQQLREVTPPGSSHALDLAGLRGPDVTFWVGRDDDGRVLATAALKRLDAAHAELKSMSEISNEMRDLAERARKRRLAPHEYQGGTTSISNLGMYGIKSFDAVINPPHATILAVGMGEKRPIVSGDKVEAATIVTCTLSCDHRVVDGAVGAELIGAFKMLVEDPVRMLV